jgi:hypothetical protein
VLQSSAALKEGGKEWEAGRNDPLVATASPMPAGKLDLRMAHTIVPRESIGATKCLLVGAEITTHLLLPCIVYRVLVTSEVVGSREDSIARFPGARIDAITPVWPSLTVQKA